MCNNYVNVFHSFSLCKSVSFVIMYCVFYCLPLVTVYTVSVIKVLYSWFLFLIQLQPMQKFGPQGLDMIDLLDFTVSEWVGDCCSMTSEQFCSYIMAKKKQVNF